MGTRDDDYAAFVRTRSHALLRSAYLLTGDQHLAEDLVQEALARTHRAWNRLYEAGNAEAYARRVMYHEQVSWWRRRRLAEDLTDAPPEAACGRTGDSGAITARMVLQAALKTLSARQRAVIVLRYFDDHTEAEAADLLGVSVSTVKTQTARALDHLRRLVPQLDGLATEGVSR